MAGDKHIGLSGVNVTQQFIRAGLLDEIIIHVVPVFLGCGVRLFDHLDTSPRDLEFTAGKQVAGVTHLTFRFSPGGNDGPAAAAAPASGTTDPAVRSRWRTLRRRHLARSAPRHQAERCRKGLQPGLSADRTDLPQA